MEAIRKSVSGVNHLLDELEGSLAHLWDTVEGEARDDEAVRTIARRILKGLRAEQ